MTQVIRREEVRALSFPVDGKYTHYTMLWSSVDNGRTWWHCGCSKYFTNESDAVQHAKAFNDQEKQK